MALALSAIAFSVLLKLLPSVRNSSFNCRSAELHSTLADGVYCCDSRWCCSLEYLCSAGVFILFTYLQFKAEICF